MVTHTSDHPHDSDLVSVPNGSLVEDIFLKGFEKNFDVNAYLGNSGIAYLNKNFLKELKGPLENEEKSIFHFLVKKMFELKLNIYSYNTTEYIKDMGTPERLKIVEEDISENKLEKKNYGNPQKSLFLDRDNTLIHCKKGKYIIDKNEIYFFKENIFKIVPIASKFDLVCLVTNQPSIAMGKLSFKELDEIIVLLLIIVYHRFKNRCSNILSTSSS